MREKLADNEAVYDREVEPLMDLIVEICQRHQIPFFCTFQIASDGENAKWATNAMKHGLVNEDVQLIEAFVSAVNAEDGVVGAARLREKARA